MAQLLQAVIDTQKNNYKSIGQVNAGDTLELELELRMNGKPIIFDSIEAELLIKKSDNNRKGPAGAFRLFLCYRR